MKNIILPDGVKIPFDADLSIEEARRVAVATGHGAAATAQGRVLTNGDIQFSRQVGGEKGN
jgi:hypothetical protein